MTIADLPDPGLLDRGQLGQGQTDGNTTGSGRHAADGEASEG